MKKPAKPKMITRKGWVARGEMRNDVLSFYKSEVGALDCSRWYRKTGVYRATLTIEVGKLEKEGA